MSAVPDIAPAARPDARLLTPMRPADVDAVMAIESRVYPFPWSRGNFIDSLAAGYVAFLLRRRGEADLVGYCVAMAGAGEMHLLNITVAPDAQRQGHARFMLDRLLERCRDAGALRLWLEVRESNAGARTAYGRLGFREEGVRPGYYPAAHGRRESAVLMSRAVDPDEDSHALD
jgi:ribosomal-protein-alanine N-acetyltransferase